MRDARERAQGSTPFAVGLRLAVAGLAGLLGACGGPASEPPWSVLLVTLDTTRADALGVYGGPAGATPELDRLAAESVRYASAYSVAPLTLPSHASMLTGLYPPRHTVRTNGASALPASARTLAEAAHEAGYATAAFLAAVVLDEGFGLAQGFQRYDAPPIDMAPTSIHYAERDSSEVAARALRWLEERDRSKRFFLWVHLFDPHQPYEPPAQYRARFNNPYHGEVAAVDHQVGRLLEALRSDGGLADTIVVVVADHGEGLGEHGEPTHSAFCYQSTIHVPLLVRRPDGARAGEVSDETVSVVDLHPTLRAAMGLAPDPDVDGISLFAGPVPPDRGAYFESYYGYLSHGLSPLAGWVDRTGKYLHSSAPELYDVERDRSESVNLVESRPDVVAHHRQGIAGVYARPALEPDGAVPSAELASRVADLGYATGAGSTGDLPDPLEPSDLPAPASRAEELVELAKAKAVLNGGRFRDAEHLLAAIVERNPGNYEAVEYLALSLMKQNRQLEAIAPLSLALRDDPPRPDGYCYLGTCLMLAGRYDEARAALARTLEIRPEHPQGLAVMAETLRRAGHPDEAARFQARLQRLQAGG